MTVPNPMDPQVDDQRREPTAFYEPAQYWAMGALALQFIASFFLGIWAGHAAEEANTTLAMMTGAASAFGWFGAWALTHCVRMLIGSVFFAVTLPGLVKRLTASPRSLLTAPRDPREERLEFWLLLFATAFNIVTLMLLYQLVAVALAAYSPASFGELWWRFALVGTFLSLFSWKALQLDG